MPQDVVVELAPQVQVPIMVVEPIPRVPSPNSSPTATKDTVANGSGKVSIGNISPVEPPHSPDHEEDNKDKAEINLSSIFSGLPNWQLNVNVTQEQLRCSIPSLSKMPTTARSILSSMVSFFSHSPAAQATVGDKSSSNGKAAPFSTPQADRKNQVGQRRMSDVSHQNHHENGHENQNGVNRKVGRLPARYGKNSQVIMPNIETWEPDVYEKELLRRTWSDDFDFLYELGSSIYCYIFEHNPNCKKLFPFISTYKGDTWKHGKEFRSQALKFVQTVAQTVKNLYHMERLAPYLYGIGQRHVKFAERGFKGEYWDIFQDAMEYSLSAHLTQLKDLNEQQKIDAIRVWRTLALYITVHMKHGFFDGLKGINVYQKPTV